MLSLWQSDARVINPRYQYNTSVITHALNTCSATGTYGIAVYHNGGVDSFVKSDAWLCAINKQNCFRDAAVRPHQGDYINRLC
ncbi:MAG TPA: hypothetical protein DEV38_05875 [Psychrobacter sp.]|nr:hypothetical protein [Psychrobacter sp.]